MIGTMADSVGPTSHPIRRSSPMKYAAFACNRRHRMAPSRSSKELQQADSPLLAEAAEIGARRIFVDGLIRLHESNGGDSRDAFHVLAEGLHRENLTAMLALESTFADPAAARAPEEFVADTIVWLSIEPVQRAVLRSLEVVKSRGHEYALGRHSFRIINGQLARGLSAGPGPPQPATRTGRRLRPHLAGRDRHSCLDELVNGG
jgi:circadian clock protein KaiC